MGPTSRDDFPQKLQVVTRLPRNPPGGLFALPGLIGGTFGGPPPLPGRLEVAILSRLPQVGELIPCNGRNFFTSEIVGQECLTYWPDNPSSQQTQTFYRSAAHKPLCID